MSAQLKKRLGKLETRSGGDLPHIVLWSAGQNFDEVLAVRPCPKGATTRLLIHRQAVEGGHGKPVTPVPLSPVEQIERDKAREWAKGLD